MKFRVSFIENLIEISNEYIRCIEIENKDYFYRFIYLLNNYNEDILNEDELLLMDKIDFKLVTDYFNLNINDKKILNAINKYIKENINEENYNKLLKDYQKLYKSFALSLNDIDIPLEINEDINIENIIKLMNPKIKVEKNLLKNIFTLIDIFKELNIYNLLILVNIKQYLTIDELQELYKYAIYNKLSILLIDNKTYGITQKYEKKIIIDDNLHEFVI